MFCFLNDQQQRVLITYKNTKYVFISTRQWRSLHTKNKLIQNQFINLAPTTLQTGTHINIVANSFLDPELKINKDVRTDRGRWGRRGPSRRGCCWGCCWGARARAATARRTAPGPRTRATTAPTRETCSSSAAALTFNTVRVCLIRFILGRSIDRMDLMTIFYLCRFWF